jgi:transcriptional regulator with XRE-family HTH domain
MVARNTLLTAPPYSILQVLGRLGANLRTARLRRRLTIADVAQKIGVGVRAVSDAEKGKPSTSVAVYIALLWVFNLLNEVETLADPNNDKEGQALAFSREGLRARKGKGLDNDF